MACRVQAGFAAESFGHDVALLDVEGGVYHGLEGAAPRISQSRASGARPAQVIALCDPMRQNDATVVHDVDATGWPNPAAS